MTSSDTLKKHINRKALAWAFRIRFCTPKFRSLSKVIGVQSWGVGLHFLLFYIQNTKMCQVRRVLSAQPEQQQERTIARWNAKEKHY